MEWLQNTLNEFESKKEGEQKKLSEEKAALQNKMLENRDIASEHLSEIFKIFHNVKKEMIVRKYPCEADLGAVTDAHTAQQRNASATLVVSNKPLRHGEKLSSGIHPHLTFKENYMSDSLSIKFRYSGQDEPKNGSIQFSNINKETIEDMVEKFIKGVFA